MFDPGFLKRLTPYFYTRIIVNQKGTMKSIRTLYTIIIFRSKFMCSESQRLKRCLGKPSNWSSGVTQTGANRAEYSIVMDRHGVSSIVGVYQRYSGTFLDLTHSSVLRYDA